MKSEREIYLLRHGQTVWNRERRLQGARDAPLTLLGCEQARLMGNILARCIPEPANYSFYISPLGRVRQTAAIVCDVLGVNYARCRMDERLCELSWGIWDGLTRDQIGELAPGELARRERNRWDYRPPEGENYSMVAARVRSWLQDTAQEPRCVVVAHGALGRVLRGLYLGLSPWETLAQHSPQDAVFRLTNGGIERIDA